jgi:membrane-bound serine protease (ClpP class)
LKRWLRRSVWLLLAALALPLLAMVSAQAQGEKVYVVHLDKFQTIDPGLALHIRRAIRTAEADPAAAGILFNIDTPGGYVTAALDIKDAIFGTKLKTIAYVDKQAWSAGALIAISAEKLYMHSAGSIGAAEPRYATDPEKRVDPKTLSALRKAFEAAAEARGRDPVLAAAMVDRDVKAPGQDQELLTLTAKRAVEAKFADGLAADLKEAAELGLGKTGLVLVDLQPTARERFARFLITPWVATLLLVAGIIALGIEFSQPGIALPGFIGLVCLGLFFAGNMLVGSATWVEIALLLLGIVLLVVEVFVPGFGIFGIGGIAAIAASVFLAVPDTQLALRYLLWMAVAFVTMLFVLLPSIAKRGLGKLLTLDQSMEGMVGTDRTSDLLDLIGQEGTALTTLRPAGMAEFGARRVDVVTEGGYIEAGSNIVVLRIEGTRVVVREKRKQPQE